MDPEREPSARLASPANVLTLARLAAAPVCAAAILSGASTAALLLFVLAVLTDLADGPLARRRGQASAFGGLLDHGTDATFVTLGLAALACDGIVPLPLPILVPLAFVQYLLDSSALAGQPLRTSWLGRRNGIFYFVLLGIPVVRDALALGWPSDDLVGWIGWALVASTLVSMIDRGAALLRARSA